MRITARASFAALVLASLFVLPTMASAAIVPKWQTGVGDSYEILRSIGDLNGDGVWDLLTGEGVAGNERIGLRSGATGALLAQTALSYSPNGIFIEDIDRNGGLEIIVWDGPTGKFNCLSYNGSDMLSVRWSFLPAATPPFQWLFADFDGNGVLYLVFMDADESHFSVYNAAGALVSTFSPGGTTGPLASTHMYVDDYDADGRSELLIDYRLNNTGGQHSADQLYMYESGAPVAVEPGMTESPSIALGSSRPNPTFSLSRVEYSLPATGPASLRLFDAKGRAVRTLVEGVVPAGRHEAAWDGLDSNGQKVPAGVYFYQLNAGDQKASQRVVRLP